MKGLLIAVIFAFIFVSVPCVSYSIEIKKCDCGYAGGNCVPCGEQTIKDKTAETTITDVPIKDMACPCGFDGVGKCLPCSQDNFKNEDQNNKEDSN